MEQKSALLSYMQSQRLMALATFGQDISNCVVYYAIDDDFCLYFISDPDSEHCKHIAVNPHVACAIADSRQQAREQKIGVQLKGITEDVTNLGRLGAILRLWNAANPGMESVINPDSFRSTILESRVYKIRPTTIKFFNESLYGEEGFAVFPFA